jgi:BirA family biotin operon repressor/biotin-[acetyl-CoA-carboxylase] ligase
VPHPTRTVVLDQVGSTNTEAFERAKAGEPGPLWIMARRQTEGRGRSGRHWTSEPGNLHASLLIRLPCAQAVVHQLSLLAGVAAIDAIRKASGAPVAGLRLKWPNDVLVGEAKCAGILAESLSGGHAGEVIAVIGVGMNLAWHPAGLDRAATHLAAHGVAASPEAILEALDGTMAHWLDVWACGAGFARVRAAWLERAGPIGERLGVHAGHDRLEGTFLDLDTDGGLIIRDLHGLQRKLIYGDVTLGASQPPESEGR